MESRKNRAMTSAMLWAGREGVRPMRARTSTTTPDSRPVNSSRVASGSLGGVGVAHAAQGVLGGDEVDRARLGADELQDLHEGLDRHLALNLLHGLGHACEQAAAAGDQGLGENLVERGVVGVEGAAGESGLADDVVDPRALEALGGDDGGGGVHESGAGVLALTKLRRGHGPPGAGWLVPELMSVGRGRVGRGTHPVLDVSVRSYIEYSFCTETSSARSWAC